MEVCHFMLVEILKHPSSLNGDQQFLSIAHPFHFFPLVLMTPQAKALIATTEDIHAYYDCNDASNIRILVQ